MMNNAWQLAVIDYDLLKAHMKKLGYDEALKRLEEDLTAKSERMCQDGDILYIVGIDIDKDFKYGEITEATMAKVWSPAKGRYGSVLLSLLRPVLTEKDVIDVELKFGIKLDDYIK